MNLSPEGLEFLKTQEGYSEEAYQDIGGIWTIGYGGTVGVISGERTTPDVAEAKLLTAVDPIQAAVGAFVKIPLNQNQIDALISFVYNVGIGAFSRSTLLKFLNQGLYDEAADEFLRWDKVNGKSVLGLARRRHRERELFKKLPSV